MVLVPEIQGKSRKFGTEYLCLRRWKLYYPHCTSEQHRRPQSQLPRQAREDETGLWKNGFRGYDATTGRYIQSDLIGLAGGLNTYAYVSGKPVTYVDQDGLIEVGAIILRRRSWGAVCLP